MNIFVLDENPQVAAEMHNDKHVVKMILETAQLLCGVHHMSDRTSCHIKTTHVLFGLENVLKTIFGYVIWVWPYVLNIHTDMVKDTSHKILLNGV